MRTYGRIQNADGTRSWRVVETTADGQNDLVYATTLCQVLQGNLNESPFYANFGIPARESIIQQVAPDFAVMRTQTYFSQFFANLVIARVPLAPEPVYRVNVTTNQGVKLNADVPIPQ